MLPPNAEVYTQGIIEFLDKRWTRAEADSSITRRSMLLFSGLVVGFSMAVLSLSVAVASFVAMIMFAQDLMGYDTSPITAVVLAMIGTGGLAVALRQRLGRRRTHRADR